VASYAPELGTAPDGSVSILMAVNKPKEVPQANWLPATYSQWPIQPHASRLRTELGSAKQPLLPAADSGAALNGSTVIQVSVPASSKEKEDSNL
jgi:hypothetical protein